MSQRFDSLCSMDKHAELQRNEGDERNEAEETGEGNGGEFALQGLDGSRMGCVHRVRSSGRMPNYSRYFELEPVDKGCHERRYHGLSYCRRCERRYRAPAG